MILRAIEEKRFLPVGADQESGSDFQLLAGTNRDLYQAVVAGTFREDRREDIAPNIDYELNKYFEDNGQKITFNKESWDKYLTFALSGEATWSANFRDLSASITRMATFAQNGRITVTEVMGEIDRLKKSWQPGSQDPSERIIEQILGADQIGQMDQFDRLQLAQVIKICLSEKSLSAAGRKLYAATRSKKKSPTTRTGYGNTSRNLT